MDARYSDAQEGLKESMRPKRQEGPNEERRGGGAKSLDMLVAKSGGDLAFGAEENPVTIMDHL